MSCYYCDAPLTKPHSPACPIPEIQGEQVEPVPILATDEAEEITEDMPDDARLDLRGWGRDDSDVGGWF